MEEADARLQEVLASLLNEHGGNYEPALRQTFACLHSSELYEAPSADEQEQREQQVCCCCAALNSIDSPASAAVVKQLAEQVCLEVERCPSPRVSRYGRAVSVPTSSRDHAVPSRHGLLRAHLGTAASSGW